MANWASVVYKVLASDEDRDKLFSMMTELQEQEAPGLLPNDFGSCWFGNLIYKLGGNPNEVYCRGWWNQIENNDNCMEIYSECAWGEMREFRHFIESKFPGMKIYYQSEEPGMVEYYTNDPTGEWFPDRYYLWIEDEDSEYFENLNDLISTIEDITGKKDLKTLADCKAAMEDYTEEHDNPSYTLEKFELVED